jgi:O-antigen/teichoic acid export membrane protein
MLGLYSLGNAITRIAEIFALMGLDNGVLRFVSRDSEDKENVDRSIYSSLKIGLISSLLISIILFISAETIVIDVLKEDLFLITVIKVFAISLPFTVLTLISSFATQAFKVLKYKIFVNQIVNPSTLLIAFIASYFFLGTNLSILLPTIISSIIGFIFIFKFLKNFSSISLRKIINTTVDNDILRFSVPLMFVSAIGIIMHWIDIIIPIADTNINGTENLKISLSTVVFIIFLKLIEEKFFKNLNININPIIDEIIVGNKIERFVPRKKYEAINAINSVEGFTI